jgi:hypothetical protein
MDLRVIFTASSYFGPLMPAQAVIQHWVPAFAGTIRLSQWTGALPALRLATIIGKDF